MKELLIIGGSDAGISAALRAREVDPSWHVRLVVSDRFPNYSICGLPFYLSGETTAVFHGMQVDAVEQLDLSYTPPLSSPWDPVQTSCMEWAGKPLEGTE